MARGKSTKRKIAGVLPRWTPAQEKAVRTDGSNILVSASAGTGKTRVLVDRCIRLVIEEGVDLDDLLVVTFTDAAAAEMRERVRSELQERLEQEPSSSRLRMQILFLDRAQISTIHSFCLRMLRENFHRIGLDPMFSVMDPDEASLLKEEIAVGLFESYYSRKDGKGRQFQELVDCYGGREADRDLIALVISLHDFIRSVPDPKAWLAGARKAYTDAKKARRLADVFWFPAYEEHIRRELHAAAMEYQFAVEALSGTPFDDAYGGVAKEMLDVIHGWIGKMDRGHVEEVCRAVRDHDFGRLPALRGTDKAEREEAQVIVHRGKERIRAELQQGLFLDDFAAMRDAMAQAEPHVLFLLDLVAEFADTFSTEKSALASVDFSDLEQFMLELLKDQGVAQSLRDRFEYVLVDEYQDINPIQDAILQAVSRAGDASRPNNLFMVGDVKQSIYRFRLAEPEIFVGRYDAYSDKDGADNFRIYLRENFRSRKEVIAAINAVFARIMRRVTSGIDYDEAARLEYAADYSERPAGLPPVELHVLDLPRRTEPRDEGDGEEEEPTEDLDRLEAEAHFVAERIEQMIGGEKAEFQVYDRGAETYRDVRYRDIVVLLRSTRQRAIAYTEALAARNIPVYADVGAGYFTSAEIEDMLNLLRVIDNPRQDIPLAAVLRSPMVGLSEPELAEIRLACDDGDFHQALHAAAGRKDDLGGTLRKFLADLNGWRTAARQRPLAELIHTLYGETGYLNYVAGLRNGAQRQANLLRLHDRACQFDRFAHHGLARFLRFIEDVIEAGSDFGSAPVLSEAEDAVRVMSIHRSKGLEFPVVFLPDLAKGINFADTKGDLLYDRNLFVGARVIDLERGVKHSSLSHMVISRELKRHTLAEEMRILYVAMTRARERLVLSGIADVGSAKAKWRPILQATSALPPFVVSDARSMLDWIWPAAAGIDGGKALIDDDGATSEGEFMRVEIHPFNEVAALAEVKADRLPSGVDKEKIAKLEPLDDTGHVSEAVKRAEQQIEWSYPATGLTHRRAKMSVSELKHRHDMSREEDELPARRRERLTELPGFLVKEKAALGGAEIGAVVHTVMRFLDLSKDLKKPQNVESEIVAIAKRGLLSEEEARVVNAGAIARFFSSEIGGQMLRDPSRVRREVPFTLGKRAGDIYRDLPDAERNEIILVQGIIDCLIEQDDGFLLLDFKTDDIRAEDIQGRIEEGGYRTQLSQYVEAVEQIFGRCVLAKYLCFLSLGGSVFW